VPRRVFPPLVVDYVRKCAGPHARCSPQGRFRCTASVFSVTSPPLITLERRIIFIDGLFFFYFHSVHASEAATGVAGEPVAGRRCVSASECVLPCAQCAEHCFDLCLRPCYTRHRPLRADVRPFVATLVSEVIRAPPGLRRRGVPRTEQRQQPRRFPGASGSRPPGPRPTRLNPRVGGRSAGVPLHAPALPGTSLAPGILSLVTVAPVLHLCVSCGGRASRTVCLRPCLRPKCIALRPPRREAALRGRG